MSDLKLAKLTKAVIIKPVSRLDLNDVQTITIKNKQLEERLLASQQATLALNLLFKPDSLKAVSPKPSLPQSQSKTTSDISLL